MSFADWFHRTWKVIEQSPAYVRGHIEIPPDRVDAPLGDGTSFSPNRHYFEIRVNEIVLSYGRQWFATYDPAALVVTQFLYGNGMQTLPFLVGPSLMQDHGADFAHGMLLRNTRVAGPYPYVGGDIVLSVVLCQAEHDNIARQILDLLDKASQTFDFASAVVPYLAIAKMVIDGFDSLLVGGSAPLFGVQQTLPAADLHPAYFALVDIDEGEAASRRFGVRGRRLVEGADLATAAHVRDASFILYSIDTAPDRSDLPRLPFFPLRERVIEEASKPGDEALKSARANLLSLYQSLVLSPDVTQADAERLIGVYEADMLAKHAIADRLFKLAETSAGAATALDSYRSRALRLLEG